MLDNGAGNGFSEVFLESFFGSLFGPFLAPKIAPNWDPKFALFPYFLGSFFGPLFGHLLDHFWSPFWGPFWDQIGPRRGQDEPKRAIKSFKDQKSYIFKKWFSHRTVGIFSLLRPPKRASRGPRRLPRGQSTASPKKLHFQKP